MKGSKKKSRDKDKEKDKEIGKKNKNDKKRIKFEKRIKFDGEFLFMLCLFIVSTVIIIGIILYFVNPQLSEENLVSETIKNNTGIKANGSWVSMKEEDKDITSCLSKYNISNNNIIFVYSQTCPFSKSMEPVVKQLEKEGYKFFWADVNNGEELQILVSCLSGIITFEGTPEFVCPKNKESHVGIFSIEELKRFADKCKE